MIEDEEYNEAVFEMKKIFSELKENNRHPTQFICDVIKEVYGHKVALNDMIKLIESDL